MASHVIGVLNLVLPAAERWFVATYNEALPMVDDSRLADDMRGFIGQEATHADTHDKILHEFMEAQGVDTGPVLEHVDYIFGKMLAPSTSTDPKRRFNHLCDRLWLIAAIEHYTAVMGDFALNCSWDDYGADPTIADLFRWHGSEEVEHWECRPRCRDVFPGQLREPDPFHGYGRSADLCLLHAHLLVFVPDGSESGRRLVAHAAHACP